jgi:hypothetical protein
MPKAAKRKTNRLYRDVEVTTDEIPFGGPEPKQVVLLRFNATDVQNNGSESPGTTPWVMLDALMLRELGEQLLSVASSIQRIQASEDPASFARDTSITVKRAHDPSR